VGAQRASSAAKALDVRRVGGRVQDRFGSVSVGSATYEIEFRGQDKAKHAHDVILGFMS